MNINFLPDQLSVGDIVIVDQPILYAVELLGSWNNRCVEWQKDLNGLAHLESRSPLSKRVLIALRISQIIFLPLSLLAIALKTIWRRHLPKNKSQQLDISPWKIPDQKSFKVNLEKQATMVIGASASGKSSLCHQVLQSKSLPYIVVDSDDIKAVMPAYQMLVSNGDEQAAEKMHWKSCELRNQFFSKVLQSGQNLLIDGTGSDWKQYKQYVIDPLRKNHYKIHLIYVETDVANCLKRAQLRAQQTGRLVPEAVILKSSKIVKESFNALKDLVDSWEQYNNNGTHPLLIAKGKTLPESTKPAPLMPPALLH